MGFDLDMTLVDSRRAVVDTFAATVAATGHPFDPAQAWRAIGLPLDETLAQWLPAGQVPAAVARYRALFPTTGVPQTVALPGAAAALAAVGRLGGSVLVLSAKIASAVESVLAHVGLPSREPGRPGLVDAVVGERYGAQKGAVLLERGASVYVGDHSGDMLAARTAGAVAVAVTTGPHDAAALRDAGAQVVLDDLLGFPAWLEEHVLQTRLAALDARLRGLGSLLVAFSGGADSAFLLAAAARALGPERVVAATGVSASLPASELAAAREVAERLGVRHVPAATDEISREGYRRNGGDRCAFCKTELVEVLGPLAAGLGLDHVATGTNADDAAAGFRPGIAAAASRGALTPLLDAGLTTAQVREASRRWGLPTWDKPAAACLASRVAYGVEVSAHRLARVERGEAAVRTTLAGAGHPARDVRVRDLGDRARLELDVDLLPVLDQPALRRSVLAAVAAAGFDAVEVDPRGFRSGAMNELLPDPDRYR